MLDFAAELSSRLASKKKNQDGKKTETETKNVKIIVNPMPVEKKTTENKANALSLFDDSSDDEETGIFTKKAQPVIKNKKSLFEDSDSDKEVLKTPKKSDEKLTEPKKIDKLDKNSAKSNFSSSDESDFLQKKAETKPNIIPKE